MISWGQHDDDGQGIGSDGDGNHDHMYASIHPIVGKIPPKFQIHTYMHNLNPYIAQYRASFLYQVEFC